jgi:hypothetical protein
LAIWGFFDVGMAKTILSLSLTLKIVFAVLLVLSHHAFLKIKSLVLLIATSLILNVVVAILIGIVPSFLVSITDAIGGIIDAVLGLIWAAVLAVISLISVLRAVRIDRAQASSVG